MVTISKLNEILREAAKYFVGIFRACLCGFWDLSLGHAIHVNPSSPTLAQRTYTYIPLPRQTKNVYIVCTWTTQTSPVQVLVYLVPAQTTLQKMIPARQMRYSSRPPWEACRRRGRYRVRLPYCTMQDNTPPSRFSKPLLATRGECKHQATCLWNTWRRFQKSHNLRCVHPSWFSGSRLGN